MESKIDWSKAPDWAKKHGLSGAFKSPVWFDDKKYTYVDGQQDGKEFFYTDACTYAAKDFSQVSERPTTPSWSGEGLPPVGTVCELRVHKLTEWSAAKNEFAYRNVIVWDWVGEPAVNGLCTAYAHDVEFRQIRTPEQIARDERDESVISVFRLIKENGWDIQSDDADYLYFLYDSGLLKKAS